MLCILCARHATDARLENEVHCVPVSCLQWVAVYLPLEGTCGIRETSGHTPQQVSDGNCGQKTNINYKWGWGMTIEDVPSFLPSATGRWMPSSKGELGAERLGSLLTSNFRLLRAWCFLHLGLCPMLCMCCLPAWGMLMAFCGHQIHFHLPFNKHFKCSLLSENYLYLTPLTLESRNAFSLI